MQNIKEGDAVIFRGRSIANWLIRFITRGEVDHVAYALNNTYIIETNWGPGVTVTPISKYLSKRRKIWVGTIKGATQEDIKETTAWMQKQVGEKYDRIQILTMFFHRLTGTHDKKTLLDPKSIDVCSTLLGVGWRKRGFVFKENVAISNLSPQDIFDSPIVNVRKCEILSPTTKHLFSTRA